jgi:mannose-1-phosphate guanylyltransferase
VAPPQRSSIRYSDCRIGAHRIRSVVSFGSLRKRRAPFQRHVDLAFDAVRLRPELTVLLGIAADSGETAYGWIEPGQPIGTEYACIFDIDQFCEKPSTELAKRLLDRACLWNSFVMVARLSTLLGLIMVTLPELYRSFARISSTLLTSSEERSIERLYASIR